MTPFFNQISIRHKLFVIVMLVSGAAVLTASAIFSVNDRFATRKALSYVVSSQAVIVAQNSSAALAFLDRQAADDILSALSVQQHIVHVGLYDKEQKLFTEFVQNPELVASLPESLVEIKQYPSVAYFELFEPIVVDSEEIGTLYVKADLNQLGITFGGYSQIIIFVLLGSLAITWVLASRLHRLITKPVDRLADIAHIVTRDNNYSIRAEKYHEDELGDLVDGINSMLEQIQKRDDLLAEQKEELENRVSSRTKELEQLSEEFKFLAYHDTLTKLPNRSLFTTQLNMGLGLARKSGKGLAVLFLDLDRFKNINDSLGHATGDELLISAAERIKSVVRTEDCVARFGGDEFTVLINQVENSEQVGKIAEQIITAMREPMIIKGHRLQVSVSLGVSLFPDNGEEPEMLMKYADTAMYSAKEDGRNTFRYYRESMKSSATLQMKIEQNLLKALREKEFSLHYQPIIDIDSGKLVLIEALLRWNNLELGERLPSEFIPLAEETGFIIELGDWVFKQACTQLRAWHNHGLKDVKMSVNFSPVQLKTSTLETDIFETLEKTGLQGGDIVLELTESALLSAPEKAKRVLARLRERGVIIALDDFGTGHSSLSYLKQLPLDILKIDRTFFKSFDEGSDDQAIVHAIVQLGRGLKLQVVAEGVETQKVFEALREIGCDHVQGFCFSTPLDAKTFEQRYINS